MTETAELPLLSASEARILGSLIEKEATTPEQYPLTQHAVQLACNQKTSREPMMALEPGEVGHALRQMENRRLVRAIHAPRAQRYEHLAAQAYGLTQQQQAIVALLLLRGPQTQAELLTRSERLAKFRDADDLAHCLERLMQRDPQMVVRLPRGPGQREDRWMHLLCGPIDIDALAAQYRSPAAAASDPGIESRLAELEARVATLEAGLAMLRGGAESV